MKTPFIHNDEPSINERRMQEAFNVAAGRVVEVEDAHYAVIGRGTTQTQNDALQGHSSFSWTIMYVTLNLEPNIFLLHWTDGVTSDWGEWFGASHEAFRRLGNLTWGEYMETPILPLAEFHSRYKEGRLS